MIEEYDDYLDVEIDFNEPTTSTVSVISIGPEPNMISTVKAMKNLLELKDFLQMSGEMSKTVSLSFSEVENVLLKEKVSRWKKQPTITQFFKK